MANLALVIVPAKALKGGRHKIRIAVSHNGETRYIITGVTVDSEKQFKNGQVVGRTDANIMNTKLRREIGKYQDILNEMEYPEGLSCAELITALKCSNRDKNITIGELFERYVETSSATDRTLNNYRYMLKSFLTYTKGDIRLRNINHLTIAGYDKFMRKKGFGNGSINIYSTFLGTMFSFARKCGYVDANFQPLGGYKKPRARVRPSWLKVEDIRRIRDLNTDNLCQRLTADMFMLSYYLGGINLIDIVKTNFKKTGNTLSYVRSKTTRFGDDAAVVTFKIPPEAKKIIERWMRPDGYIGGLSLNPAGFISKHMKDLREQLGMPNLVYYSARKSFSQQAFELGVSTQVIDYVLGHSQRQHGVIFHYVAVKPEMATLAIRRVINHLNADLNPQTAVLAPIGEKIAEEGTKVEQDGEKIADAM